MKKQINIIVLLMVFLVFSQNIIQAEVLSSLGEISKPTSMVMDDNNIYIAEGSTVFIYSQKDSKLLKKFGKKGEGPQDFKLMITRMDVSGDNLVINSVGKISLFKKNGNFIREFSTGSISATGIFLPLKKGYVGTGVTGVKNEFFSTVSLFDQKLNRKKVLLKYKSGANGKIDVLGASKTGYFQIYNNQVFIPGESGLVINKYNHSGQMVKQIKEPYKAVTFTRKHEEIIRANLKKMMPEGQYELAKNRFIFPDTFPEMLNIQISDNLIYAVTWEKKDDNFRTFVFSLEGKKLKDIYIPLQLMDGIAPSPMVIKSSKLYQLIENQDSEEWELHSIPLV